MVEWRVSPGLTDYREAEAWQEARVAEIAAGRAPETVWLLEHPALYTAGTGADPADLLDPDRFPVFETGRGGQYTYHGPGQRVAYAMLDVAARGRDVRALVWRLEEWAIRTVAAFGVTGERRQGRVGVWVRRDDLGAPAREDKIAAIGVRLRRWVSFHGIAVNVAPDLSHFDGIVPCGVAEHGVTSLRDLGVAADLAAVDQALTQAFDAAFDPALSPAAVSDPETTAAIS